MVSLENVLSDIEIRLCLVNTNVSGGEMWRFNVEYLYLQSEKTKAEMNLLFQMLITVVSGGPKRRI